MAGALCDPFCSSLLYLNEAASRDPAKFAEQEVTLWMSESKRWSFEDAGWFLGLPGEPAMANSKEQTEAILLELLESLIMIALGVGSGSSAPIDLFSA